MYLGLLIPGFILLSLVLAMNLVLYSYGDDNSATVLKKAQQNLAKNQIKTPPKMPVTPTQPISQKPSAYILPKADFTNSNFNILFANPDGHFNSTVYLTGKIFNFPGTGELQMHVGASSNDVVIVYDESFVFTEDDCVKVTGRVAESFLGTNAFGATRSAPEVKATTIDKINCADAINPAAKTVKVEKTQFKAGIKVTLHKVEFSDKNTRAYLTVVNLNGKAGIRFYDFDSKAIQGNRQFSTTYSYDVDYPSIKSDIPPGIVEDGVVLFDPINYKIVSPVKFQFKTTRSDTYTDYDFFYTIAMPR